MKLNIKKLQAGGYLSYQPLPIVPTSQAAPAQQAQAQPEEAGVDKELLTKLVGNGLTNDVMAYSKAVNQAYTQYASLSEYERDTYKGRSLRNMMKGDFAQINALIRSKDNMKESLDAAKSNDSLGEFAVTKGGMFVKDNSTGKIGLVSFQQYAVDAKGEERKYTALTNADLAKEREYNDQLIGDENTFAVLKYGRGMTKVKEEVLKIANYIKSSTESKSVGEYGATPDDISELETAVKAGLFKEKAGESLTSNKPQLEKAKYAMWTNLSQEAKDVLRANAAATPGADPSKIEQMAMSMAASLLDPYESYVHKVTADESLGKGGKGGSGSGGKDTLGNFGGTALAYSGMHNNEIISFTHELGMQVDMIGSMIPDKASFGKDGKRTNLDQSGMRQVAKVDSAFAPNGEHIDPRSATIIGPSYYVDLVVTRNDKGEMVPDYSSLKKMADFNDAVKANPGMTYIEKEALKRKMGINGKIEKFVIADAASYEDSEFFSNRDSEYFKRVDPSTTSMVEEALDAKSDSFRSGFDQLLRRHIIIMPALDLASAHEADGNSALVSKAALDIGAGGFNSGANGANGHLNANESTTNPLQSRYSFDQWNKK